MVQSPHRRGGDSVCGWMAGELRSGIGIEPSDNGFFHIANFLQQRDSAGKCGSIQAVEQHHEHGGHQVCRGSRRRNVGAQWPGNILRAAHNHTGAHFSARSL